MGQFENRQDSNSWWDVTKVWTPVDDQVWVRTWDWTLEWTTWLTFDWSALSITPAWWLILWTDVAWWTPNIAWTLKLYSAWDNAFYNTFTSWTNTANANYTLPTAMPAVSWYQLTCTDAWVMSWATPWWLAWGDSVNWNTSTTWLTLTADASSTAWDVLSIVINDTQTNAVQWININMWTSTVNNREAILITQTWASNSKAINLNTFRWWQWLGVSFWGTLNDANYRWWLVVTTQTNAWSGRTSWVFVDNNSTAMETWNTSNFWYWSWVAIVQRWVDWTWLSVYWKDSPNTTTNWLVNFTMSNDTTWASIIQKINMWNDNQAHTWLFIVWSNASTSAKMIDLDIDWNAIWLNIVNAWTWKSVYVDHNWSWIAFLLETPWTERWLYIEAANWHASASWIVKFYGWTWTSPVLNIQNLWTWNWAFIDQDWNWFPLYIDNDWTEVPMRIDAWANWTATSANAWANWDVPAQVVWYLIININWTNQKIPYYAV